MLITSHCIQYTKFYCTKLIGDCNECIKIGKDKKRMNRKINNENQYNAIDLIKFIASLFVVAIHCPPFAFNEVANLIFNQIFARLAVPFFFITSGFFLFRKFGNDVVANKILLIQYIKRILILYIIWSIVYLPWIIEDRFINNNYSFIFNCFALIRNLFFIGIYGHLWYLLAVATAAIIIYMFNKFLSINKTIIIAFLFYIIGIFGDSYISIVHNFSFINNIYSLYFKFFESVRNGLFFGFIFMGMGMIIVKKEIFISKQYAIIGFILSLIGMFIEVFLLKYLLRIDNFQMYFFMLPTTFFLFQLLLNVRLINHSCYYKLRKLSLLVYLSHFLFINLYNLLQMVIGITNSSLIRYCIVVLFSLVFSQTILKLEQIKKFKWLKYIHQ